jgi:hypothetical protein
MRKFFITSIYFTTILFTVVGLALDATSSSSGEPNKLWGDNKLSVRIDKVERLDTVPDKLKSPGYRYHPPKKGNNFVLIRFATPHIRNTNFIGLGGRDDDKSVLYDSKGVQFKFHSWFLSKGLKSFKPPIWGEKALGFFMFEGPKDQRPAKLIFKYYFKDDLKNKSKGMGEIEIDLSEFK